MINLPKTALTNWDMECSGQNDSGIGQWPTGVLTLGFVLMYINLLQLYHKLFSTVGGTGEDVLRNACCSSRDCPASSFVGCLQKMACCYSHKEQDWKKEKHFLNSPRHVARWLWYIGMILWLAFTFHVGIHRWRVGCRLAVVYVFIRFIYCLFSLLGWIE